MAAPTFVGAGTFQVETSTTALGPVGLPSGVQADDIMFAVLANNAASTFTGPGDGWTQVSGVGVSSSDHSHDVYWKRHDGSESAPTFTTSATMSATVTGYARIYAWRGCTTSGTPFEDATAAGTPTSSTTPSTAAIDTTGDERTAVCFITVDDDNTWNDITSPPTGWSEVGGRVFDATGADGMFDCWQQYVPSAATVSAASATMSAADFWRTTTLALIPQSTAAPVHPQPVGGGSTEVGTSLGTNNAISLPSGVATGDLLLAFVSTDVGSTNTTTGTGSATWGTVFNQVHGANERRITCFGRIATGSDALVISGQAADYVAHVMPPIRGHGVTTVTTDIFVDATNPNAATGNADPPSLDTGASDDYLWIACAVIDASAAGTAQGPPQGYVATCLATSATDGTNVAQVVAWRQATAQTEDPGAATNLSQDWLAKTIAVPPGESGIEIAGSIGTVEVEGVSGATQAGAAAIAGSIGIVEVEGVSGAAGGPPVQIVGSIGVVEVAGISGTVLVAAVTVAGSIGVVEVLGMSGTIESGGGDVSAVAWILSTAPAEDGCIVRGEITVTGGDPVLIVSENSDLSSPVGGVGGTAEGVDNIWWFDTTSLSLDPATVYHYGFNNGTSDVRYGKFCTLVPFGDPQSYVVVGGSCWEDGSDSTFTTMLAMDPEDRPFFTFLMGDNGYDDPTVNSASTVRAHMRNELSSTALRNICREGYVIWQPSDHDIDTDDGDETSTALPAVQTAFRQVFGGWTLPSGTGMYYKIEIGRTCWLVLDCFSFRDPEGVGPDMLGSTQKTWLQNEIDSGTFSLGHLCVEEPWIIDGEDNGWDIYPDDREDVANMLQNESPLGNDGWIINHGDQHALAHDDGTNSNYATTPSGDGPYLVCYAPIDQTNSTKGGPYTTGPITDSTHQWGSWIIEDSGGATLTCQVQGWSGSTEQFDFLHTFDEFGGAIEIAGSVGIVEIEGRSATVQAGAAAIAGSVGIVEVEGRSATVQAGAAAIAGSVGIVEVLGVSGTIQTAGINIAGSVGIVEVLGVSGTPLSAAVTVAGSVGVVEVLGISGGVQGDTEFNMILTVLAPVFVARLADVVFRTRVAASPEFRTRVAGGTEFVGRAAGAVFRTRAPGAPSLRPRSTTVTFRSRTPGVPLITEV